MSLVRSAAPPVQLGPSPPPLTGDGRGEDKLPRPLLHGVTTRLQRAIVAADDRTPGAGRASPSPRDESAPPRTGFHAGLRKRQESDGSVSVDGTVQLAIDERWRLRAGGRKLGAETEGEAFAGARLRVGARQGPLGGGADVDAFAGVKYQQRAKVTVAGQSANGQVEGRAGIGASAKVGVGLERVNGRDKLRLSAKGSLAIGVGAGGGVGADIDVTPIVRPVRKVVSLASRIRSFFGGIVNAPARLLHKVIG